MPTNIEIKARAKNFLHQKSIAESISDTACELIEQEDIFFHIPNGRLKLRILSHAQSELIFYHRENSSGPKQSHYIVHKTNAPHSLIDVLVSSLGIVGVVKKKRQLYFIEQTRIHFDEVEGLGEFIELEVVMNKNQPNETGIAIAHDLMKKLEIEEVDLISEAYIDLLANVA